ncbi:DUF6880 family protein [Cupriavidus pinatubonensis]|uniref:DUF6880 family protein n=1 Tax=Cupriavidus pinatubonensis TaxID=248026 RepID=UPI00112C91DC|nr:DUF6880 family protein [Cupriavidus pinatubonensis]TPQ26386.1 hypothetical protein C2U69_34915 [Cupriavidus pinatubonensis]
MPNPEDRIDAKVLATLGPERLAILLAEVAETHPRMWRRLRFELAAPRSDTMVAAMREWISELSAETSFPDQEHISELSRELDAMRVAIASPIRQAAPDLGPSLMWEFLALAETVYERTTEEGWEISAIFDEACSDLVKLSIDAGVEPAVFAAKIIAALNSNQYGEYRTLIQAIGSAETWAPAYVSRLKALLESTL